MSNPLTVPPKPSKPVTDLSVRAISLARRIDRLPEGEYTIKLVKPEVRGQPWEVHVTRVETILDLILDRAGD